LLGVAALGLYLVTGSALHLWWAGLGVLVFALVSGARVELQPCSGPPPTRGWRPELVLWATGAACMLVPLWFHRVDYDSAFYISMAIGAADHPGAPLMMDTIHGVQGIRVHMPAHRIHSFELFQGAVSYLTGTPVSRLYYQIVPPIAALLVPLAYARLFRILTPRHWIWNVLVVLAVLVGGGATMFWYGDFSLVRIGVGKSLYLSVFLPLAYAYGLAFGSQPSLRRWLLLVAVQVAAIGCSSSALWSVPIAACAAMACSVRWNRDTWRTLALGVLASSYVVAAGLTLYGELGDVADRVASALPAGYQLERSLARALGDGALESFALAALLLAPALRRGLAQRFAIVVPLIALTVVLNPYFERQVASLMTGPSFWRAMWSLPLPVLMTLLLTSPLQLARKPLQRVSAALTTLLATAGFVAFVPEYSTLSTANRTRFGRFGALNVEAGYFQLSHRLRAVPSGSMVVAPVQVGRWLLVLHHHPYIVALREGYLRQIGIELGTQEFDRRMNMVEQVSRVELGPRSIFRSVSEGERRRSRLEDPVGLFREGIRVYDVRGVCIHRDAPHYEGIVQILREAGFSMQSDFGRLGNQVWIRR
jgi:hypothetical protein